MKTAIIIFNSKNKRNIFLSNLDQLVKELNKRGYQTILRATLGPQDAISYITQLDNVDLIVGSGGDGTINELVNGVSKNPLIDPEILFYPTGTVNDYASSLRLKAEYMSGIELLDNKQVRKVDSALVNNETYCNYVVAFGPFTSASYQVSHQLKRELGSLAYVLKAITDIVNISKEYQMRIVADGREFNGLFNFGLIVNSHSVAGVKYIFRSTDITDGYYTLFLVRHSPQTVTMLPRLLVDGIGKEYIDKDVICISFKKLEIFTEEKIEWTIDGERGPVGGVSVEVIPGNVSIYTPL